MVAAVASAGARAKIERALIAAGYRAGRDYVLAADAATLLTPRRRYSRTIASRSICGTG